LQFFAGYFYLQFFIPQVSLATGGAIRHSVGLRMRLSPSLLETPASTLRVSCTRW